MAVKTCDPTQALNSSACCDFRDYQSPADAAWLECMKSKPQCLFTEDLQDDVKMYCQTVFNYNGESLMQKWYVVDTAMTCIDNYANFYAAVT